MIITQRFTEETLRLTEIFNTLRATQCLLSESLCNNKKDDYAWNYQVAPG